MNTVSSTTVDIKKTLLHYIKAEFKEKDLDMLKSLLGSIYTELKYSLQGTTQGRYLTGGVPPVRFSM